MNGIDQNLLGAALQVARTRYGGLLKSGFVPSEAAAGGAPPPPGGDPAMGGGPPPEMGPPPEGGPPGGEMPPPGAGMADPASIAGQVAQGVQQGMAASGLKSQGGVGPGGKPMVKPDINTIATDVFQLKKMLFAVMRHAGIELPPDTLDGPNRDPQTGAPAESPTGGSDVPPGASMQQSAISPIEPIQGAFPPGAAPGGPGGLGGGMGGGHSTTAGGGFGKIGGAPPEFSHSIGQVSDGASFQSKAAATAILLRRGREAGVRPQPEIEKTACAALPTEKRSAANGLAMRIRRRLQPQEAA